ncbi:MAG: sugar phosphate nucleotidyltransferase [Anaerolineae bacterium]
MKAVILATNESINLAPLTDTLPDSMLPLTSKPVMAYTIELLARAGINDIVICLQRMGGSIEAWFGSGRRWGVNISYSLQRDSLGDAGAMKWAKSTINSQFIVLPGNALLDLDIQNVIEAHKQSKCSATIITGKRSHTSESSIKNNDILNEQTGAYIFEPELLDLVPSRETFDIQTQLIPLLKNKGIKTNYFNHSGYWNPIESFNDLKNAQVAYLMSASESPNPENDTEITAFEPQNPHPFQFSDISGNRFGSNVWAGKNNIIHPSVRIYQPVVIGDNCQVGRDVELGPFTIIGSNSIIDDEASIRNSTVSEKTYIGKLVNVEGKLVTRNLMIDFETGLSAYITDPFLIGEASPPIINNSFRLLVDKFLALLFILILLPLIILIGLFSLLGTGRIFKVVQRIGIVPGDIVYGDVISPSRIELRHFNTRRENNNLTFFTRWIEKSSLHRLPELFSVVSGNLSFVGVKPLLPEEADLLIEEWHFQRYSFSAGFTGLWYTECTDGAKDDASLIYDIYYVAVRSFKEDLRILIKTPSRWIRNLLYS